MIDRGETVVRLPPRLMADARQGVRERGKSDPIDALAIARAALREGVETLPTARLAGVGARDPAAGVASRTARGHPDAADQRAALAAARPLARVGDPQARADPPGLADQDRAASPPSRDHRPGADRARHDHPGPGADPHDHRALRAARRPRQAGRAAAAGREGPGRADRGQADRRDRRDRPVHQRRATRADLRMRPDPGLIRTHRPSPPRPRRQPATQPRLPHARAHQDHPRPAGPRSTSPNNAATARATEKRSAASNATSSAASTTSCATPTASRSPSA